MTGFGSAEDRVLRGRLRVEIRTVNHRYFNPQLKLPADLAGVEAELRERLRQLLERGHVAVTARWVEAPGPERTVAVDLERARQIMAAAQQLKKKLKLKGTVDLAFVARQPDVFTATNGAGGTGGGEQLVQWSDVQAIVERAARDVVAMRDREGKALCGERSRRLVSHLAGSRHDTSQAPVRVEAHVGAVRAVLQCEEAVGKQLGFLAQELLREVNTMGSKANDARITQTVIAMKGDLEKFREQLENLE